VLAFIGTPGRSDEIREAVNFASLENIRKLEERQLFWLRDIRLAPKDRSNLDTYKVRRGKVAGYRDYFNDDQLAQIERLVREQLSPFYGCETSSGLDQMAEG
jgi:hypothetical protein